MLGFPFKIMSQQSTKDFFLNRLNLSLFMTLINFHILFPTKNKLPPLCRSNVVYEVGCPGCGKTYIGISGHMSNAFSLCCIYLYCKVLYSILSDDDFEIKSKIYSFNLHVVLKHILHSQDFGICFLLYFFKLLSGHGVLSIIVDKELDEMKSPCYSLWYAVFKYYSGFSHFYY